MPKKAKSARQGEYVGVVSVRASAILLKGLDQMAAELAEETGVDVTRSDMARKILHAALLAHETGARR